MLSSILVAISEWLLSKLGAFLLLWGKKEIAAFEEKKTEDKNVEDLRKAEDLDAKEKAESALLNG